MSEPSYFPLLILITDTQEKLLVDRPEDIPKGVGFTVLKCNANQVEEIEQNP